MAAPPALEGVNARERNHSDHQYERATGHDKRRDDGTEEHHKRDDSERRSCGGDSEENIQTLH